MGGRVERKAIVEAVGLSRIYGEGSVAVAGLREVNLSVREGELVVLKGESGSGKSTLLSLLGGLDTATSGRLTVAGVDLAGGGGDKLTEFRREVVGMVFQSFNLLPTLSVLENVCLPARLSGRPAAEAERAARERLAALGLTERLHHFPGELSGGQMQRCAIARALINDPRLLLADEPTGNLDSRNGRRVMEMLAALNREGGMTVIVATHSDLADPFATRIVTLVDGSLAEAA